MTQESSERDLPGAAAASVLRGRWVELRPAALAPTSEIERLLRLRNSMVLMGGAVESLAGDERVPLMVTSVGGRLVGIQSGTLLPDSDDVAVIETFVDPAARVGAGLEAAYLYLGRLFDGGIQKVRLEIAEFNRPALRLMASANIEPEAWLRSHVFIAGRWHTLVLFGVDRRTWVSRVVPRFQRLGLGSPRAAAISSAGQTTRSPET